MPRFLALTLLAITFPCSAQEGELAKKLANVKFEHYAEAPGYSEGPTWRNGEVFFCSGALWRVDAKKDVHKYLEINPAGTVLLANGHMLIADNKHKAILDLAPDGKLGVLAEHVETQTLRGLNDLTVDARGNVYWTDPEGSSLKTPVGNLYRLRPDGRVDRIGGGLAFPNGIEVDPASKKLYVIESQSKKILVYDLPGDDALLGKATEFYDLGGSGGDGCAFDAAGNLWVADFHRPETGNGRITVLSPEGKVLAHLPVPAKVVSNIAFGGLNHDEIFCTTGTPPGVFHAKVGVKGFRGHPGKAIPVTRYLNVPALKPHPDADWLRSLTKWMVERELDLPGARDIALRSKAVSDLKVRNKIQELGVISVAAKHQRDKPLLAEIKRLGGKATIEVTAPMWLREIVGDSDLQVFGRIVEIDLNERTDGHKKTEPKKLTDRVTNDTLKLLADQDMLRRLELSGTAITSDGFVHLKNLKNLERLNVCLTAADDRGFEHLAGLTKMKRMTVCASKITGSGFKHLQGMKQLESINLHSSPASDEGLAAIGKLTSLKRLEIVHTNVTDAGITHLAGLVNLQQFHVHGPTTTPAALPFLGEMKELYELDIYDKAASNMALELIAKLPKLRLLMLVNGVFDDDGVKHLRGMTGLEQVTLDSPKVTDASIETLGSLTRLRKLHLGRAKLSAEGKHRLQALLPGATITP